MKKFKAEIMKTETSNNLIMIQIEDKISGCRFAQLDFNYEEFGKLVGTIGTSKCEVEFFENCPIGKIREIKTEDVKVENEFHLTDEQKNEILKPYEVDGWLGNNYDIGNYHRRTKNGYKVNFTRFVEKKNNDKN